MGVLSRRLPFLRTAQGRVSCRETICGFFEVLRVLLGCYLRPLRSK